MSKKPRLGANVLGSKTTGSLKWIGDKKEKVSVPRTNNGSPTSEKAKVGLQPGWTRRTYLVREDFVDQIESLAFVERKKIKDIVNDALGSYLSRQQVEVVAKK